MKTSFYFVLWIIIYPLLGLFNSPWINQNSFIVALLLVWGISWWLNKTIPNTLRYEAITSRAGILEEIYSGRITSFRRRLTRQTIIEFVTAVYFGVALVFIIFSLIHGGDANDWIALAVFVLIAYGTIRKAAMLNQASREISENPTQEECSRVAQKAYGLNYEAYESQRTVSRREDMIPPMPRYYMAFQIISLIIAIGCAILGVIYLVLALIAIIRSNFAAGLSAGIMYFLYGSLATYFGIRDTISCILFLRNYKKGEA